MLEKKSHTTQEKIELGEEILQGLNERFYRLSNLELLSLTLQYPNLSPDENKPISPSAIRAKLNRLFFGSIESDRETAVRVAKDFFLRDSKEREKEQDIVFWKKVIASIALPEPEE